MQFIEGNYYHIYNRGNNKQAIFFKDGNYDFFLQKVRKYIVPNCEVLAWALMPNHFHFLIRATEASRRLVKEKPIAINALTEGIRLLLSSYTKAIQKQENLTGSLFQQKTKFKEVKKYETILFHYIHQNPLRANLVNRLEDWKWSSFNDYLSETIGICETELAYSYLDIDRATFLKDSYAVIPDEFIDEK